MNFIPENRPFLKRIGIVSGLFLFLFCARQNPAIDETELAMKQSLVALQKQLEDAANSKILSTESNADGSYTTKVRAISYDTWVKFNFSNLAQAAVPDSAPGWDVGFQRFKLQTNSGLTNPSGNGGSCMTDPPITNFNVAAAGSSTSLGCPNASFSVDTNVSELGAGGVQTNYVGSDVLNKWFDYSLAFLQPNNKIFIIRSYTGNEYYVFQVIGYYSAEGTSAYPTVKWKQIPY